MYKDCNFRIFDLIYYGMPKAEIFEGKGNKEWRVTHYVCVTPISMPNFSKWPLENLKIYLEGDCNLNLNQIYS